MNKMRKYLEVKAGVAIDKDTGKLRGEEPFYMASQEIYRAKKGERLEVKDQAFLLGVVLYGDVVAEEYMYTYMYEEEQNWSCYTGNFSEDSFSIRDYVFREDSWFRICLKKADGNWCIAEDAARINEIIAFYTMDGESLPWYFAQEVSRTADTVLEKSSEGKSLVFALLSDSHYTVNGTWEDTITNLKAVHQRTGLDGIIHLGDLQDGMLDKRTCRRIATKCIADLRDICEPLYLVIGNHDTNYFKGNQEWLTEEEQYGIYGRFQDRYVTREGVAGYYYTDYAHVRLRMIFLTSFDHREKLRYGFPEAEIQWLKCILDQTPDGYKVLVFSHDAPLARLDYWAEEIRNGERLLEVLEEYHTREGKEVLGYIHGHTHADYIYRERKFPIISIGCSKCECFPDKKPEGSVRYMRKLGGGTQELWDVLVITPDKSRLELVRFGAGEDRSLKREVKVWGHRGASGYAPENTLEAFSLAADMGADGVELDVQFSRDEELVVVHDEWLGRVSDGIGSVKDYTLQELETFNFNKTHPEYAPFCKIPTLREVLTLLQDTDMTVNIELKTGVYEYPGIEKRVVELVHEMGWQHRVLYSSFNHQSVMRVREYDPEARIAYLYSHQLMRAADYAELNHVYTLNPSVSCAGYEEEMQRCREKNIEVNVWTVDSEADMRKMDQMGVNAIITNYPDLAKKVLSKKNPE